MDFHVRRRRPLVLALERQGGLRQATVGAVARGVGHEGHREGVARGGFEGRGVLHHEVVVLLDAGAVARAVAMPRPEGGAGGGAVVRGLWGKEGC